MKLYSKEVKTETRMIKASVTQQQIKDLTSVTQQQIKDLNNE
jgi:hypothetical protein